ncbi:MAG: hypothetical protein ABIE07_03250 [Candidatus Zixiibacteriota bacterium]
MKYFILFLSLGCLVFLLWGCGKDKSTSPEPAQHDYQIVFGTLWDGNLQPPGFHLPVLSSMNDSIYDSIPVKTEVHAMCFSGDGSTLFLTHLPEVYDEAMTWVIDWKTKDTIAAYSGRCGRRLSLSTDNNYLLVSGYHLTLFSSPELNFIYEAQVKNLGGLIIPNRNLACYCPIISDSLCFIDFNNSPVSTYALHLKTDNGLPLEIESVGSSLSGDSLILLTNYNHNANYLVIASTDSLDVIDIISIPYHNFWYSYPIINPSNNNQIFFFSPGNPFDTGPGTQKKGALYSLSLSEEHIVSIFGENENYYFPGHIALSPDNSLLYVTAGILLKYQLPLLELSIPHEKGDISGGSLAINPLDLNRN